MEDDVETELAYLDAPSPACPRRSEVFVGCSQFEFAEDFFFAEQPASGAWVFGHADRRRGPRIADQPLHHLADFRANGLGEADAAPDALGGLRHQAFLDDVAGMLEIGRDR